MRAFLSLFLPLLISSLHAEKIITNPNWVARNTPVVTVDSILLRDTVSRMYITLKQLPHTSLTIHDDWVVQDSIKRFSGKVRDIDGVDFDRIFQFDSDSTIHIEMDFPALPPSLTEVDIIGNQKSNEIRIIGLSLTEKRNKTSIYPQPNPIYRSATPAITFDTDTAILQGKFVGYHKRLNLPDGKIILDDLFSGKQTEINIPIAPDGSFSAKIPTRYPIQQKLIFGDRYIPFYIEPTDTLYIETYLDELFAPYRYSGEIEQNCVHSTYRGKNARINYELREIRLKNISETEDWIKSLNTLSAQKYYTSEENKFKVKLEYVNSKYNQGEISDTSYHLSILNNYYNFIERTKGPRKDPRKGADTRRKTGARERNVAHPNGEEHSRVAKGNGRNIKRVSVTDVFASIGVLVVASIGIAVVCADDVTLIGIANDAAIAPLIKIVWDCTATISKYCNSGG